MKCFIGFSVLVIVSMVGSSPAMSQATHGRIWFNGAPIHERIHLSEESVEVKVTNGTDNLDLLASSAVPSMAASLTANASENALGLPYVIKVPLNGSENELGNFLKIHENCSHCLQDFNGSATKQFGCMCALFTSLFTTDEDAPLMSSTFHNVSCHENVPDQEACDKVCVAVAKAHSDVEEQVICSRVQHADSLTVFLHSKICENGTDWNYTGLSSEPVCCHNGHVMLCHS